MKKSFVTDIRALLLYLRLYQLEESDNLNNTARISIYERLTDMDYPKDPTFDNEGIPQIVFEFIPGIFLSQEQWIKKFYEAINWDPDYFKVP